ncbi:hypothetical protein [Maribellus sp. YY47]|uniref:hypothetical protein n=1 Tax=Maribellus sp. YY47 TaxID=2929486 RepID=UPI0020017B19|nr:hypothetical protein [Maribellus sp. YY47]MCK3685110.1 hypothetical protein [Maribellus sp. YY47]
MVKRFFAVLVGLFCLQQLGAQEHNEHGQEHEHHHVHEFGISFAPVYFTGEDELSVATHLHYVYNFPHTKFGLGVGYERIFDDHKHNFLGLELEYRPVHPLTIGLSPGFAFEGGHGGEKEFALHFETIYEMEFGAFHIGPLLELAYHPEDFHVSIGVHIGLGL